MRGVPSFLGVSAVVAVGALAGCGPDLGQCSEPAAATEVVYAGDGTPYYAGQALVHQSCAGGLCHAASATGEARKGAPHGLNFDVDPLSATSTPDSVAVLSSGIAKVRDEASDMYGEIDDGSMPPGAAGTRPAQSWKSADGTAIMLPTIDTPEGKSTVRNWLACGAPVVSGVTGATAAASIPNGMVLPPGTIKGGTGFAGVYDQAFGAKCSVCHQAGGLFGALDLSTADKAYTALVGKDPAPAGTPMGECGGAGKLVIPNDCANSLLYKKLKPMPPCGMQMPLGDPAGISATALQAVCDWINMGAKQ